MGRNSFLQRVQRLLSRRRSALALLPLVLLAALVRLPGTARNLPFVFHWDEPTLVNLSTWLFTEGSLNPRFFNYPGGMIYLLGLLFLLTLLGGMLVGAYPGWAAGVKALAVGTYPRPPGGGVIYRFPTRGAPMAYILGRLFSVVLGTLTVWWAARLAERLAGRWAAWLAGGLLALNALHAANSVLVTTDVACGAFLAWFLLALVNGRSPRTAGIALGLAAACKYTGGIGVYLWPLGLVLTPLLGSPRAGPADPGAGTGVGAGGAVGVVAGAGAGADFGTAAEPVPQLAPRCLERLLAAAAALGGRNVLAAEPLRAALAPRLPAGLPLRGGAHARGDGALCGGHRDRTDRTRRWLPGPCGAISGRWCCLRSCSRWCWRCVR